MGEQELLAIISALRQWRCCLEGAKGEVTVVANHKPNTYLNRKPTVRLSSRQVSGRGSCLKFRFEWDYNKGVHNVADPISVKTMLCKLILGDAHVAVMRCMLCKLNLVTLIWMLMLMRTHMTVPMCPLRISRMYAVLTLLTPMILSYSYVGEYWRRGELIIVPDSGDLRTMCMSLYHDTPYAGTWDVTEQSLIMQTYWRPTLDSDVRYLIPTYHFCQRNKSSNGKPTGLLQPLLSIPEFRWQSASMDFIVEFPKTNVGHTAALVFVDRLSNMVHFAPCWNDIGAQDFFVQCIFATNGLPQE